MEGLARACSLSATQLFAGYLLPTQYMYDAQTCNATNHQVYMSFMPKDLLPLLTSFMSI